MKFVCNRYVIMLSSRDEIEVFLDRRVTGQVRSFPIASPYFFVFHLFCNFHNLSSSNLR